MTTGAAEQLGRQRQRPGRDSTNEAPGAGRLKINDLQRGASTSATSRVFDEYGPRKARAFGGAREEALVARRVLDHAQDEVMTITRGALRGPTRAATLDDLREA